MMRIVCPVCGDEPKKGQRHICAPLQPLSLPATEPVDSELPAPREEGLDRLGSGAGVLQRRGLKATPNAVCSSIASLVQKNPGLWRSTGALARCRGEAFVAGLLSIAIASASWNKDPKGALIAALNGRVADEAARAIQACWRRRCSARGQKKPIKKDGYKQLALVAPRVAAASPAPTVAGPMQRVPQAPRLMSGGGPRARPPPLSVVLPRNEYADQAPARQKVVPALQSPTAKPETPRNKSNPRPNGGKAVPMNPLQAMKHRRAQQEKDVEEKRIQQLLEAEDRKASRARGGGGGSVPASPQGMKSMMLAGGFAAESIPSSADTEAFDVAEMLGRPRPASGSLTPTPHCLQADSQRYAGSNAEQDAYQESSACVAAAPGMEVALTPLERRALRQSVPSPRSSMTTGARPPLPAGSAALICADHHVPSARRDGEIQSAPTTMEQWRSPEAEETLSSSHHPVPGSDPASATARLRERMRQRDNSPRDGTVRARSPADLQRPSTGGGSGWQNRIEARQREAEEFQVVEAHQREQTNERSNRRNDALRKVMERQAQRQQEVEGLEA